MFTNKIEDKLRLVLLTQAHAKNLFTLIDQNRSYLEKWMVWPPKTKSSHDTKEFIKGCLIGLSENREMACGIEYEDDLVGVITFNLIDHNLKKVILGYWISDKYQGKGIITKSCNSMIDYAFKSLEVKKVEIRVASENIPSQRVCERLGFTLEGLIRNSENLHGTIVSHNIYGLTENEHNKNRHGE